VNRVLGGGGILCPTLLRRIAMGLDIDGLSEAELIDLNNRVVARLKFLQEMRAHASMLQFRIGEKVCFHPDGHPEVTAIIIKYNRKSVTVITESGQKWSVAPVYLRKVVDAPETHTERGQVLSLPRKSS
jgi:hypothetical protein